MLPAKRMLSWFAVTCGVLVGILALAIFGFESIPQSHLLLHWCLFFGLPVFALVALVGSITAIQTRLPAAVLFLISAPVAGFCFAYYETRVPSVSILTLITLLYFTPLFLPLIASRHLRWVVGSFIVSGIAATLCLASPAIRGSVGLLLPPLAEYSTPFLALGWFWLATHRLGWPPVIPEQPFSFRRTLIRSLLVASALFALLLMATVILELPRWPFMGDCRAAPPFVKQRNPRHVAFTATALHCIYSIQHVGRTVCIWALAAVQERFWGLPWWESKFVILRGGIYHPGQQYFIDGERQRGVMVQFLPLVDGIWGCGRSASITNAEIDLRILRAGPPIRGVRLIGRTVRLQPDYSSVAAPGIPVVVAGPAGTINLITDAFGIYDLNGIPAGRYSVRAPGYAANPWLSEGCDHSHPMDLKPGDVAGCNLGIK